MQLTNVKQQVRSFRRKYNLSEVSTSSLEAAFEKQGYSEIGNYAKLVLLMHGDRDGIVPISYAEHAAEVYPDVDYYVIRGGGHGFYGNALDDAFLHILEYLQKTGIL